jgi:hypothetical protein
VPRTTLTLEEDVAARIQSEARRLGRPFKAVVNELLRFALNARRAARPRTAFKVKPRDLGLQPGLEYDDIGGLLEQVEGSGHR